MQASSLKIADEKCRQLITEEKIRGIVEIIPETWLEAEYSGETPGQKKEVYYEFLKTRLQHSATFVNEALNARKLFI